MEFQQINVIQCFLLHPTRSINASGKDIPKMIVEISARGGERFLLGSLLCMLVEDGEGTVA